MVRTIRIFIYGTVHVMHFNLQLHKLLKGMLV